MPPFKNNPGYVRGLSFLETVEMAMETNHL